MELITTIKSDHDQISISILYRMEVVRECVIDYSVLYYTELGFLM